jgi:hypothetical protein
MKGPIEKKKTTEVAEAFANSGLETYVRPDGAVMIEIAPHSFLSADHLWLASGRRMTAHSG